MLISIGCDIAEHDIAEKLNWRTDLKMRSRIFTTIELNQCNSSEEIQFLCGRFAAKEAVLKCLGTGFQDGISPTEIEIIKSESGLPKISLYGNTAIKAEELNIQIWHVSISHSTNYSIAIVTASKIRNYEEK